MNIDRFKDDHVRILDAIGTLRQLTHGGVLENADAIAREVVVMSSTIKLHLSAEDRSLYPALKASGDQALVRLSASYQHEMGEIADNYAQFAGRWNTREQVAADPEGFRADANHTLKAVHDRMQRENRDFYPRIEGSAVRPHS